MLRGGRRIGGGGPVPQLAILDHVDLRPAGDGGHAGHVAGICNPPGNSKACYWTADSTEPGESPDEWLERSTKHKGSWWEDWAAWADVHGGAQRQPFPLPRSGEPEAPPNTGVSTVADRP